MYVITADMETSRSFAVAYHILRTPFVAVFGHVAKATKSGIPGNNMAQQAACKYRLPPAQAANCVFTTPLQRHNARADYLLISENLEILGTTINVKFRPETSGYCRAEGRSYRSLQIQGTVKSFTDR